MIFNYSQIYSNFLKSLSGRQKTVISRRFGLKGGRRETLDFIGKDYKITRERVRQIERDGFLKLEPQTKRYQKVFQQFKNYLKNNGELKREDLLLREFGGNRWQNQVFFLFNLEKSFKRFSETADFYPFWTINGDSIAKAEKFIKASYIKLEKIGKPIQLKELSFNSLNNKILSSYLEISKKIQKNSENLFGLSTWPEINPKGIKDKAYLVFKKEKKPLHFSRVAKLINGALPQTVHNELIKDYRFVLIGRGLYALGEWGYEGGVVKDVILKILKESKKPLTKKEILKKVLKERLVKENTILLNLSNKKYFAKNSGGLYNIKVKKA